MKTKRKLLFLLPLIALTWVAFSMASKTFAYNYTDFLMDDSTMRNAYTMTATNILNFLQQKNSGLANFTDVYICGYPSDSTFAFENSAYDCNVAKKDANGNTYYQTQPQSAALIIAEAAQAYGMNPQAILATMQKEESLVTTPNPVSSQLNFAMGYGCPDSTGCSNSHTGFFNQVDWGTWQLRLNMELMSGNTYFGIPPSSYACNGATRYYSTALKPGNNVGFKDDYGTTYAQFVLPNASTSSLYCYTPHVFPGSARQYFSGSYWFVYYFSQWFGSNTAPYAFKGSNSSTIYFYINGTKVAVPAMGIIQDYGVSPNAIHTLDQSTVDSIPAPSDGSSSALNYIVKSPSDSDADGGSVYLVTVGKIYQFQTFQQFAVDFNVQAADISYEPLSFIRSIPSGGALSSFVSSPPGSVFQIQSGQKHLIFDYSTYIGLNPSDQLTSASYYIINKITTGSPLSNREILVKYSDNDAVYLFDNNNYYSIQTFDTYSCWGFDSTLGTPVYRLPDNSYIPAISITYPLGCFVNNGSSLTLLSRSQRFLVPAGYGLTRSQVDSADIVNLSNKLPAAASSLKQYIKPNNDSGVWYLMGGIRKVVPTFANYQLLGLDPSKFDTVDGSDMSSINISGIKLGDGKVVKSDDNAAVYVVEGGNRIQFSTSDDFVGYQNAWSDIETYSAASLNADYPYTGTNVGRYLLDTSNNKTFLVDANGCYLLNSSQLTDYGNPITQSYKYARFNESSCASGSLYIKQKGTAPVYLIQNGQKRLFTTWMSLVNNSGTSNPYVLGLAASTVSSFPSGANMN